MRKGIFDTHAHYNDKKFEGEGEKLISFVHENGVDYICNVGANIEESIKSIELAKKFDYVFCSVGIHPFYASELEEGWEEKFLSLLKNNKVVAIGEAGLDYSQEGFNKKDQFEIFEKQLDIAKTLNIPFIVHSRDAQDDTLAIIKNFPEVKGVIHCFSGDDKLAEKYAQMGWYIGFTGVVTFKNAKKTVRAALAVDEDKMVVETDCPYMAPEPLRGNVCNSSMIPHIIQKIADIRKISYEEVLEKTRNNAFNLYKIKNKEV